jgi:hypothetical protein
VISNCDLPFAKEELGNVDHDIQLATETLRKRKSAAEP